MIIIWPSLTRRSCNYNSSSSGLKVLPISRKFFSCGEPGADSGSVVAVGLGLSGEGWGLGPPRRLHPAGAILSWPFSPIKPLLLFFDCLIDLLLTDHCSSYSLLTWNIPFWGTPPVTNKVYPSFAKTSFIAWLVINYSNPTNSFQLSSFMELNNLPTLFLLLKRVE